MLLLRRGMLLLLAELEEEINSSEVRMHLEEVRTALQNNDIQGALMHLDLALNQLGGGTEGNMTSTTGATNSTAELATQGR